MPKRGETRSSAQRTERRKERRGEKRSSDNQDIDELSICSKFDVNSILNHEKLKYFSK